MEHSQVLLYLRMMLQNHNTAAAAIEPNDLQMLQRVFDMACQRRGIAKNTSKARLLAADVIDLFQHGVRTEAQLIAMLSGTKDYP